MSGEQGQTNAFGYQCEGNGANHLGRSRFTQDAIQFQVGRSNSSCATDRRGQPTPHLQCTCNLIQHGYSVAQGAKNDMTDKDSDLVLAKQQLRDAGLRATAARVAVIKLMSAIDGPMSHSEVVESLSEFGFDQSTLFRCLNELADAGLAARLDLGDQTRRFELRNANGGVEFTHPHFMCVDCGELTCMNDFSVQISPSRGPRRARLGTVTEILIRGHCGNCGSAS